MSELASQTALYSGSDLKELCRNAAMVPVREYIRSHVDDPAAMKKGQTEVSPMTVPLC